MHSSSTRLEKSNSRYTPRGTKPQQKPRDRNRRRRWLTLVNFAKISRGAKAWCSLLAERSSDSGKPVWGNQKEQARILGCSDRQVRRYRVEAEDAKLLSARRFLFDGVLGKRPHTNIYSFSIPPGKGKRANAQVTASGHGRPIEPSLSEKGINREMNFHQKKKHPMQYVPLPMISDAEPFPDRVETTEAKAQISEMRKALACR